MPIRKDDIGSTDTALEYESAKWDFDLPPGYELLSAAAKSEAINMPDIHPSDRMEFLDLSARKNALRAFSWPLRPAASGMQSYLDRCHCAKRAPLPISADSITLWVGLFRTGETFGFYRAHFTKAAIVLRHPADWITPDIRAAPRGLENAHGLAFRRQSFMFDDSLLTLIRHIKLDSEFELAAPMSSFCEYHRTRYWPE